MSVVLAARSIIQPIKEKKAHSGPVKCIPPHVLLSVCIVLPGLADRLLYEEVGNEGAEGAI